MATTRDQLIGDWRRRLAEAESDAALAPRLAWLARMRVRLYRFLLACYGRGDWPTTPPSDESSGPPADRAAIFDSAAAQSLTGKPAKSVGEIRSVLNAVAGAHEEAPTPGPLAAGLDPASWVIVAAASSKLKIGPCCKLLRAAGLHPRTCNRGDDQMVEVPAHERQTAFAIIDANRDRIHQPPNTPRTQRIPLWCRFAALAIVALWLGGILAWLLEALAWSSTTAELPLSPTEFLFKPELLPIWGSLFVALLLVAWLSMIYRGHPRRGPMR